MKSPSTVPPPQGALTEHTRIAIVTAEALLPCRFTLAIDGETVRGPGRGCGLDGGLGHIGSPFFSVFPPYTLLVLSTGWMDFSVVFLRINDFPNLLQFKRYTELNQFFLVGVPCDVKCSPVIPNVPLEGETTCKPGRVSALFAATKKI